MSDRIRVKPVEGFDAGDRELVEFNGRTIAVINYDGEFYALLNHCLHEGGPVCRGRIQGALVGEHEALGERVAERISDRPAITCPWHGWEYDLESGRHTGDPDVRLPTFDVEVDDGVVYLVL